MRGERVAHAPAAAVPIAVLANGTLGATPPVTALYDRPRPPDRFSRRRLFAGRRPIVARAGLRAARGGAGDARGTHVRRRRAQDSAPPERTGARRVFCGVALRRRSSLGERQNSPGAFLPGSRPRCGGRSSHARRALPVLRPQGPAHQAPGPCVASVPRHGHRIAGGGPGGDGGRAQSRRLRKRVSDSGAAGPGRAALRGGPSPRLSGIGRRWSSRRMRGA